jgi:protein-disulfide isomerase
VIVPLFALSNAGIHVTGDALSHAFSSPITWGIIVGYLVGKPLGILGGAALGVKFGRGLRRSLSWPVIAGGGVVAGIGFTVSLLISSIAFHGQDLADAKIGVLTAAALAAMGSWVAFQAIRLLPARLRARQVAETEEELVDLSEEVDPERDHIRGGEDALVTLVEYGDYECPYCGQAEVVVRELLVSFGDDLRYVWRHLPLNDVHPNAQLAAEAAEAAAAQGEFWGMHDKLLAHQDELTPRDLGRYADELGLDLDRFWDELRGHTHAERIEEDVESADASGVAGTPSFFINGRRHSGAYDVATLTAAVRGARWRADLLRRSALAEAQT